MRSPHNCYMKGYQRFFLLRRETEQKMEIFSVKNLINNWMIIEKEAFPMSSYSNKDEKIFHFYNVCRRSFL